MEKAVLHTPRSEDRRSGLDQTCGVSAVGERLLRSFKSEMASTPPSLAQRFREMTSLWHLWRASVLEDLGDVPAGLEEAVESELKECLQEARERLHEALRVCDESLDSLSRASSSQKTV